MLIVQMNGYLLFFSADRQHTYQSVCSKRLRIGVKYSTDTKSTKTIAIKFYYAPYIMGNMNFAHFAHFATTKCGKCAKFTLPKVESVTVVIEILNAIKAILLRYIFTRLVISYGLTSKS